MRSLIISLLLVTTLLAHGQAPFAYPKAYVCLAATGPVQIDGEGNELSWQQAAWSTSFVDIEGDKRSNPYLNTRVKMLWDDNYLYFLAELEEPQLWANLTKRDAIIFHDNDFEIFIDPDGDTHNYYEFEINALNTVWDLLLTRPYRDGGQTIDNWDIKGLKTAIKLNGTLNDPADTDIGWTVEIAMPWSALKEAAGKKTPPADGDMWRINFSRVQWETYAENGKYIKKKDVKSGKQLPENNWVWTPQRAIAMHEPEFWGLLFFTSKENELALTNEQEYELTAKRQLYEIHRKLRVLRRQKKPLKATLDDLGLVPYELKGNPLEIKITTHTGGYIVIASHRSTKTKWLLDHTGRSWKAEK